MLLNIGELFFIILDLLIGIKSKLTFVLSVKYSRSLETFWRLKKDKASIWFSLRNIWVSSIISSLLTANIFSVFTLLRQEIIEFIDSPCCSEMYAITCAHVSTYINQFRWMKNHTCRKILSTLCCTRNTRCCFERYTLERYSVRISAIR